MPACKQTRPLSNIAHDIRRDWRDKVNYAAKPYLASMFEMDKITDTYGYDTGKSVVLYFLSNAKTWRGPVAQCIKAELRAML